jgi:hypothetical protein
MGGCEERRGCGGCYSIFGFALIMCRNQQASRNKLCKQHVNVMEESAM